MKKAASSGGPPSSSASTIMHTPSVSVPAAATSSRQSTDASSLTMVLRQRISELGQEVLRLKEENAALLRAKTRTHSYQGRLEALLREVHTLEAVQADHNLALDKLRTSIDPAQLRLYLKNLQARNTEAARTANEHVLQRQHLEQEADRLLEERTKAAHTEEDRIKLYVDAETFELYQELRQQKQMLEREVRRQEEELAKVYQEKGEQQQHQQQEKERSQEQQQYQQQYQALQVELRRLESMRRYLEEEELPLVSLWTKGPAEAEARLLAKIKEDQQRTEEVEEQCSVLREGVRGGGGGGFEVAVERARQELQEAQEEVRLLVEYLLGNNNINSDEIEKGAKHKNRKDDLNPDAFNNEEEEEGGEEVRIELLREWTKRLQEFEKLRTIREKIVAEIKGSNQKADSLKEEMDMWASRLMDGGGEVGEGGGGGGGRGEGEGGEGRVPKEECLELVSRLNALLCEAGGRVG